MVKLSMSHKLHNVPGGGPPNRTGDAWVILPISLTISLLFRIKCSPCSGLQLFILRKETVSKKIFSLLSMKNERRFY